MVDDRAPAAGGTVGVANSHVVSAPGTPGLEPYASEPVRFEREGGTKFFPQDTNFGAVPRRGGRSDLCRSDSGHRFHAGCAGEERCHFHLTWTDGVGGTDLDFYVTGTGEGCRRGRQPERARIGRHVQGRLEIRVEPYFITDPTGVEYTLTAVIDGDTDGDGLFGSSDQCPDAFGSPPSGCPDQDRDGVLDPDDVCPDEPGDGADGCPIGATEHVHVYVDGVLAASQDVDTANGRTPSTSPCRCRRARISCASSGRTKGRSWRRRRGP